MKNKQENERMGEDNCFFSPAPLLLLDLDK
jgi:hypothetical protein